MTAGLVLVLAALLFLVVPAALGWMITHPTFRRPGPGPGDVPGVHGLPYEEIRFTTTDQIQISGWFIPAPDAPATVVVCHGLFNTRLEGMAQGRFLHRHGYNVLLHDFRRHGHSDTTAVTLGYFERLDVLAAIRAVRQRLGPGHPIVVLGISMGGAAGAMAAAECPDVAGLVLDSCFLSLRTTVADHARLLFHLPRYPFASEVSPSETE